MLFTSNLINFDSAPSIKPINNPNKIRLVIPCLQAGCLSSVCNWKYFKCEQDIEYGCNRYLYCGCGESSINNCKFRCVSPHHIEGFVPFELKRLVDLLPSTPPEEVNILLLDETGMGKSTFINVFVNYLKFNTLNDAKFGNMDVLILLQFSLSDENYETKTIKIGNNDSNEQLENVSMSATQECRSYIFYAENKLIRLIDTPGIGDTRGIDQDKKNFENILKFCIQELLSHLHRSVKDNIVFCFTNARGTFYHPGDTFLAAIKKDISFTEVDEQNYAEMIILSKPLAEIGQLIQTNIKLIKEQQKEIVNSKQTIEELKDKLYIPQIDLEPEKLGHPRTVCISNSYVEVLRIDQTNEKKIDYIKHCHPHCYLDNVECNMINNAALRECAAINSNGKCENYYLDHFINEEKIKKSADPNYYDDEILKGLKTIKRSYLKQIEVIK
ncbi:hypothetical protein C1645_840585 [Glomus cerebriforme]|uniref:DUF8206 domain-containing protein n=1 Tax=Glomus cerebriforme TaxID=658196 RepID=A0A397SAX4_9GLOM|nr:hypothetical protein C1645_840585 [Glomus cerebriforme]